MSRSQSSNRSGFGRRSANPSLADALSKTRPVRYLTNGGEGANGRGEENNAGGDAAAAGGRQPGHMSVPASDAADDAPANGRRVSSVSGRSRGQSKTARSQRGNGRTGQRSTADLPAITGKGEEQIPARVRSLKAQIMPEVFEQIDYSALTGMTRAEVRDALEPLVLQVAANRSLSFSTPELAALQDAIVDEIVGFGPLEPLLADSTVADILVNGPNQVYAERTGQLERTSITFRDDDHVMQIANRICNWVGRRVDVSSPMADARLPDGSRVNIIIPPLSLRGPSISIRKFSKHKMELMDLAERGAMSRQMASFLQIATNARLNILISGGTGAGKTTLLNALSQYIDPGERIVTIEDSAELQLHQPHLVPLETRPRNLEGAGEVTIRDLLVNALRMRPDRIIVGEVRGEECFDMLQAFNTGHDGGMCTIHANRPREALSRLENLVAMGNPNYPTIAVRQQIAETIDLIVQVKRMRGGIRRITDIVEVVGTDGEMITTQPLFKYELKESSSGKEAEGRFTYSGITLSAMPRVLEAGLGSALKQVMR